MVTECASEASRRWPYVDEATTVALVSIAWPALTATPAAGDPAQAWVNFLIQVVVMIVAALIVVALTPKPPQPKPASLADFSAPTAEEGKPMAKVFGECWIRDPNVIWYGDLFSQPITKKGGK